MPAVKRQKRPVKRELKDCLVCATCFERHRETGLGSYTGVPDQTLSAHGETW
ncbi:hypothetical protein DPMN_019825 [Dreissena polymorpha]|uniref:Uncharacterized protein n=1 Tax=Dreissena polymorpha TaxID=45954 RepID=A0A9D4NJY2_DREPO|nr:hypothetical protein DPMN_019825 [Dreissena polymorpha]